MNLWIAFGGVVHTHLVNLASAVGKVALLGGKADEIEPL